MSTVAQSRDLSDRKTIENFAAVVQSLERMKLLTILTTADIRAVGPGVWNGWKAQLLRTLYYETEPVLTGGFSEVNRAQRVAAAQAEFRADLQDWPADRSSTPMSPAIIRPTGSRSICRTSSRTRVSCAPPKQAGQAARHQCRLRRRRAASPSSRFSRPTIRGCCRSSPAPARSPAPTSSTPRSTPRPTGIALDTIAISREFERDEDEATPRRPHRRRDRESGARQIKLPEVVPKRAPPKGRLKAFVIEPEVTINNQWSQRYTVVEVTGLDRPGLLYELTTTLSKLNLNIASAHVATFGERVVDVFYVTDLLGAKITTPTRQAAIKRPLLALFAAPGGETKAAKDDSAG